MKPDQIPSIVFDFVTSLWTPAFVVLFLVIVGYALWPRNRATFDEAARMPLRED